MGTENLYADPNDEVADKNELRKKQAYNQILYDPANPPAKHPVDIKRWVLAILMNLNIY
jgi:hypothetical protein